MDLLRSLTLLILVAWFANISSAKNRKINMEVFDCPINSSSNHNRSIIHVQATGPNSTIHHLWTTYPVPTIVVGYTSLDVSLNISCGNLTADAHASGIEFHPPMNYTIGFAVPRMYEYDDEDDNAKLSSSSKIITHDLSYTRWSAKVDYSSGKVTFTGNKSLIFECTASDSEGRESSLPHLLHTADSSRFSLSLNNLNLTTNKTRFAFELSYVVEDKHKVSISVDKSIDDEYTPAVFETVYGKVTGKNGKSYSQWKPIAYTLAKLGQKYQTRASAGDIRVVTNRSWNIGQLVMPNWTYQIYGLNVSFGLSKDGFYQKNKYLTWCGIVGYGEPAKSSLSFFVILTISIGLGLPLTIIIFGGTYAQIRKHYRKSKVTTTYDIIN